MTADLAIEFLSWIVLIEFRYDVYAKYGYLDFFCSFG
jgi:hypothetical protein